MINHVGKTSCKYPIRRREVKVDTVPHGNMNYIQDIHVFGPITKETEHRMCGQRGFERSNHPEPFRF